MSGYAHLKWYYQFLENICAYLQVKFQFQSTCFSGDSAKICKCILGTLGMLSYTQPKW